MNQSYIYGMNIKSCLFFVFLVFQLKGIAQKDSLTVGKYWEDQLYVALTYNVLKNQPSGISYGFSGGYIKDIPVVKSGKLAIGLGVGYAYDYFKSNLLVNDNEFELNENTSSSTYKFHALEFPVQLRWRSSDEVTYSFWRIYMGLRFSYNLSNKFSYTLDQSINVSNIEALNRIQKGLELSVGYGAFNLFAYYGLSDVFKDAVLDNTAIETSVLKLGLIFYLL